MRQLTIGVGFLWLATACGGSPRADGRLGDGSVEAGAAEGGVAGAETVQTETVQAETVQAETVQADGLSDPARAVGVDSDVAAAAIARLRGLGRPGLDVLLDAHPEMLAALRQGRRSPRGERFRHAIDQVSGQRDGHASGLYWHTDLDAAQEEARQTGRPILSLRLLGRLDEEMSCANSRYFRIVLYSHPELAATLRRDWVLHWSSERPAPRITIDMGDGRQIVTTITGNSVHYVLDEEGQPLDALVGLYTPEAFGDALASSRELLRCDGEASCLTAQHVARRAAFERRWAEHAGQVPPLERAQGQLPAERGTGGPLSATSAMELTIGKMIVETPLLRGLGAQRRPVETIDWERIGNVVYGSGPSDTASLHPQSQALLRLKTGRGDVSEMAARLAAIARADTARNEVLFRLRIRELFRTRPDLAANFERLNAFVYAQLLETPIGDPWLGLRSPDLYDGVEVQALD